MGTEFSHIFGLLEKYFYFLLFLVLFIVVVTFNLQLHCEQIPVFIRESTFKFHCKQATNRFLPLVEWERYFRNKSAVWFQFMFLLEKKQIKCYSTFLRFLLGIWYGSAEEKKYPIESSRGKCCALFMCYAESTTMNTKLNRNFCSHCTNTYLKLWLDKRTVCVCAQCLLYNRHWHNSPWYGFSVCFVTQRFLPDAILRRFLTFCSLVFSIHNAADIEWIVHVLERIVVLGLFCACFTRFVQRDFARISKDSSFQRKNE